MPKDASLCVSCGYNAQTGQAHQVATTGPSFARRLFQATGPLLLGTILSGVGALIGGAIWFTVTMITNYEIDWIAWGVGALAGLGMHLGTRGDRGTKFGVIAAGMSVAGILAAKVAIFCFMIYAVVTGDTDDKDLQRWYVTNELAEEILDDRGVFDPAERDLQMDDVLDEAYARAEQMTDQEVRTEWERYRRQQEEAPVLEVAPEQGQIAEREEVAEQEDEAFEEAAGGLLVAFAFMMFGHMDLLFVGLAVVSAFRIGSRGLARGEE
jgi:phosphate/sulfate permease